MSATNRPKVEAAVDIKQAVTSESPTVGGVIDKLDSYAVTIGGTHVSVWTAIVAIFVIVFLLVAARLTSRVLHRVLNRSARLSQAQKSLADKMISIGVWTLALLVGLDVLGISLTALTVFSGAFGLAIGFGLQKTFGNLIAGIILLLDRSIKPGDVIAVSDQAGNSTFGQVKKIGIRAVSVTTRDQREYLIPNENLMINQVENWSYSSREVRMQIPVGVAYTADLAKAEALMLEAARACKRVLNTPPPVVWLEAFGDSSVNFIVHCWINDPEQGIGNVRSDVLKTLWTLFAENGVELPYPQRDLHLRGSEALDALIAAIDARPAR